MMRNQFKYTRVFNKWKREFAAAAAADKYVELMRPLNHLKLKCSPANMLACTNLLVRAVMGYCQMDGRECEAFLKQQHYRLDGKGENFYCLTFDLTGTTGSYFGRILTDTEFTYVDFADLFMHNWSVSSAGGFTTAYITRLDGKRVAKKELKQLYDHVTSDMFSDYTEEEISVDVCMSEFEDTAYINANEAEGFEPDLLHLHRAVGFITKFGR